MATGADKPFLPFEIIINILKRFPVKSIVRLQCVCKDWKNLFKTPSFIAEHFHHSDHDNPFLLLLECNCEHMRSSVRLLNHKMETVDVLSIPTFDSFRRSWTIIGSCNGLLCVELYPNDEGKFPSSLWLWNPMLREVREVPNTLNDYWHVCTFGFGFSSVVNDYKIVRFYNQELHEKKEDQVHHFTRLNRVEVFSLSTDSWKERELRALNDTLNGTSVLSPAVNVNGTLIWQGRNHRFTTVVSFDKTTEVFLLFLFAPIPTENGLYPLDFGVCENKLEGHFVIQEKSGSHFIGVSSVYG
ncbi:F-box protein At3g22350-like [Prosopis cineraria]|uniref:F-box protein At3g22350-like n=1 Tax=Prosopis cineraria TaxID=364024 RepID=UPI00241010BE|nr:F-box protein At3g22350-like [Prosopis cineraria]XP_054776393.1 F-box protein At3g22350-like [Prosopis cineraria]